jgi:hypothetical protein
MIVRRLLWTALPPLVLALSAGCYSPYAADRGALVGGVGGAGVGALVGNAVGHPVVGTLVGAGVGAASGAAVGGAIDQADARNRALIESRLGRPAPGAVTVGDVINMSQAGVPENVMITHIQNNGLAAPLGPNDLITLNQFKVSPRVVQVMQTPPMRPAQPIYVQPAVAPVVAAPTPVVMPQGFYGAYRPAPVVVVPPPPVVVGGPAVMATSVPMAAPAVPPPPTPMPPPAQ